MTSIAKKERLTEKQIDEICLAIPVNKMIAPYISMSIYNKIRTRLTNDLSSVEIYPELFPKFKNEVVNYYYKTLAAAGEAVGVMTAQSIGERQTQNTLNTFHSAGLTIKTVVTGVPRFSELLNATKEPKMVNCLIYLNEQFGDISEVREAAGNSFTDITLRRLTKSSELIKDEPLEDWHHLFCDIYGVNPSTLGWRMRFYIDIDMLYEYKVTLKMIADVINTEYNDAIVLYTPDWKGILDVFVDESCFKHMEDAKEEEKEIEEESDEEEEEVETDEEDSDIDEEDIEDNDEEECSDEEIEIKLKPEMISLESKEDTIPDDIERVIHMEDKVLPALLGTRICGIPNIKDIFFEKRKDEWIITTEGSNLYGLFSHPLVDKTKTLSNDMWEIYNIFGIEAARQFLIEEYMDIVSSDGTYVNSSNVELLVDVMVYTGSIISISRYGQKKVGCGPMAKASFEESLENFLKAAVNGEKESTDGVSASIMLGKMPKTGTGVFDLIVDIPKLMKLGQPSDSKKEIKQEKQTKEIVYTKETKQENMENVKTTKVKKIENLFKKLEKTPVKPENPVKYSLVNPLVSSNSSSSSVKSKFVQKNTFFASTVKQNNKDEELLED